MIHLSLLSYRGIPLRIAVLLSTLALSFASQAFAARQVFFTEPADGKKVSSPFKVRFGLDGMKIAPAGDMTPGTGHHHLIINGKALATGEPVPFNETHLHFGKGQTETELKLPPGDYTLTLQFGNGVHQSYGPAMSRTIKVRVVGAPK